MYACNECRKKLGWSLNMDELELECMFCGKDNISEYEKIFCMYCDQCKYESEFFWINKGFPYVGKCNACRDSENEVRQ